MVQVEGVVAFLILTPLIPDFPHLTLSKSNARIHFSLQGEVKPIGWSDVNGWVAEVAVNFEMCHKQR